MENRHLVLQRLNVMTHKLLHHKNRNSINLPVAICALLFDIVIFSFRQSRLSFHFIYFVVIILAVRHCNRRLLKLVRPP